MQGLQSAESIAGATVDIITATGTGTGTSIVFTAMDHIQTPHGYVSSASPPGQLSLKCPRCDSTNTKFCYYNNYNLSQPRHFCKACRRYWTKGGVLRNVPVGGGCRKSKRGTSGSKSSKSTSNKNCKRTAASGSTSDTSTVTSVDHTNTDPGLVLGETCCTELPSQLIAPSMHDLEFSLPDPMHSQILKESNEATAKTKVEECALPEIFNQTVEADLLPVFQAQFGSDSINAFSGHDWSLSIDHALFDLPTAGTGQTGSIWNQHNWSDAVADPALYLP